MALRVGGSLVDLSVGDGRTLPEVYKGVSYAVSGVIQREIWVSQKLCI